MARRPHYGAEKRQKELKRQQKQEEKALRRQQRRDATAAEVEQEEAEGTTSASPRPMVTADESP